MHIEMCSKCEWLCAFWYSIQTNNTLVTIYTVFQFQSPILIFLI